MKKIALIICCYLISFISFSQTEELFQMKKPETNIFKVNQKFNSDAQIAINGINTISSLSISGKIKLIDSSSLVRVILSTKSNEFLVYEVYPLITDSKEFVINKVCEETSLIDGKIPVKLILVIRNAELQLDQINVSEIDLSDNEKYSYNNLQNDSKVQIQKYKSSKINYNNTKLQKTWYADTTRISLLPFEEKKKLFGGNNDFNTGGFEYYSYGIFSLPDFDPEKNNVLKSVTTSNYVSKFDWRNRHGQNWMTSIKNQGNCGACSAFSAVAATEAMFNVYYNNDDIDLNLSEQAVFSCSGGSCTYGMSVQSAVNYILNTGVVNEGCFPYLDAGPPPCSNSCSNPNERINITSTHYISGTNDGLKNALINTGPLAGAVSTLGHAMCLLGYNVVEIGDTIQYVYNHAIIDSIIVAGNPLIGLTYWIFKNSYGTPQAGQPHWHANGGYVYIFVQSVSQIYAYTTEIPYSTVAYNRYCTDADNDGYYWWGTGNKPTTCPICASDTPDGDDSNASLGPIDTYGNILSISSPYTPPSHLITSTETWQGSTTECGNVIVKNGGNLTIDGATINLEGNAGFSVEVGGILTFNNGVIQ